MPWCLPCCHDDPPFIPQLSRQVPCVPRPWHTHPAQPCPLMRLQPCHRQPPGDTVQSWGCRAGQGPEAAADAGSSSQPASPLPLGSLPAPGTAWPFATLRSGAHSAPSVERGGSRGPTPLVAWHSPALEKVPWLGYGNLILTLYSRKARKHRRGKSTRPCVFYKHVWLSHEQRGLVLPSAVVTHTLFLHFCCFQKLSEHKAPGLMNKAAGELDCGHRLVSLLDHTQQFKPAFSGFCLREGGRKCRAGEVALQTGIHLAPWGGAGDPTTPRGCCRGCTLCPPLHPASQGEGVSAYQAHCAPAQSPPPCPVEPCIQKEWAGLGLQGGLWDGCAWRPRTAGQSPSPGAAPAARPPPHRSHEHPHTEHPGWDEGTDPAWEAGLH